MCPLIITYSVYTMTLPVCLNLLQSIECHTFIYCYLMSCSVLVILPLLIVFAALQLFIVSVLYAVRRQVSLPYRPPTHPNPVASMSHRIRSTRAQRVTTTVAALRVSALCLTACVPAFCATDAHAASDVDWASIEPAESISFCTNHPRCSQAIEQELVYFFTEYTRIEVEVVTAAPTTKSSLSASRLRRPLATCATSS